MSSTQRYLPIVEEGKTNHILGLIDVGSNVVYDGDELTQEITEPGGAQNLNLVKIEPPQSTVPRNPWYMAAVFTHQQILDGAHKNLVAYVSVDDVAPATFWSSGSGLAHVRRHEDGVLLRGLSNENGFAV